jgi:undecaprenyl-diphosphatase
LTSRGATGTEENGGDFVFFDVMLHVGTAAAIVIYYRKIIFSWIHVLITGTGREPDHNRATLLKVGLLIFVTMLPLVPLKLFLMKRIEATYHSLPVVGLGFLTTALVLLATLRMPGGTKGLRETTWVDALIIGIAQSLAPLPGVSRSGMTVAAALLRGFDRGWAVGFSLLIAVPTIAAAAASKLLDVNLSEISPNVWAQVVSATLIAGIVGFLSIHWLVRIVRSGRIWYFSVYLLLLSAVILGVLVPFSGKTSPHVEASTVDRPVSRGADRAGVELGR